MKEPDEARTHELEAWLDGRLTGEQARAFEERLARDPDLAAEVELARRIRASLVRCFPVPGSVDVPSRRPMPARPGRVPEIVHPRIPSSWLGIGLAALAAGILFVVLVPGAPSPAPDPGTADPALARGSGAPSTSETGGAGGAGDATAELSETCLAPVGPLQRVEPGADAVRKPDLEWLYAEAASCGEQGQVACGVEDDVPAFLHDAYDEDVRMLPDAANLLHGPFSSSEWPTGTILTGYPDEQPAVLVAETNAMHRCCLEVELPAGSELNLFTWQVGELVLTEITPLDEPRLIGLFE